MKFAPPPEPSDNTHSKAPPQDSSPIFDDATGLPGFRSWRSVYLFVAGSFIFWVILLVALHQIFS